MDTQNNTPDTLSTIIPTLRYRDAPAAIDWLCKAFGFEALLVVPGENATIAHAQLTFGSGMIMLGSAGEFKIRRTTKTATRRQRSEHTKSLRRRNGC